MANRIYDVIDFMQYAANYANSTTIYHGWAAPNASQSDAVWRIKRETLDSQGRTTALEFADGDQNFDNRFDQASSLSYGG